MSNIPKRPTKEEIPQGQDLLEWVNVQIEKYQKYMEMSETADINFFELNEALANYNKVSNALLVLYIETKAQANRSKKAFEDWYADKYVYYRDLKNPQSLSAQKYYTAKELEQLIRSENKAEYSRLLDEQTLCDEKHSFTSKLMGTWDKQLYVLQALSKNITNELGSMRSSAGFNSTVQNHIREIGEN